MHNMERQEASLFLSTNRVGASSGLTVRRHSKKKRRRETLAALRAQRDDVGFFSAVDRNDRDSADYSTTIKTTRYDLRFLFWMLYRVVHTLFVVVVALVSVGLGKPEWKKYTSKNSGRHDFQVDLAIALMNYAIEQDWDGGSEKPSWMRQRAFVPCNCGECYFCIHGHTTGVQHRQKNQKVKMVHVNRAPAEKH